MQSDTALKETCAYPSKLRICDALRCGNNAEGSRRNMKRAASGRKTLLWGPLSAQSKTRTRFSADCRQTRS